MTASHKGFLQFNLCANDDTSSHLNQSCFDQHILEQADGSGTRYNITRDGSGFYFVEYNLTLPINVTCEKCVIQWTYTTANNYGICQNGTGAIGCGHQEQFRGCSDVAILSEDTKEIDRNPSSKFDKDIIPAISYLNGTKRCERIPSDGDVAPPMTTEAATNTIASKNQSDNKNDKN